MTALSDLLNPEKLRAAHDALVAKRESILKVAGPLRAARDEWWEGLLAERAKRDAEIKAAEGDLAEIDRQIAVAVRALGASSLKG